MKLNDFVFFPGMILEVIGILVLVTGLLTGIVILIFIGAGSLCAAVVVHAVRISRRYRAGAASDPADKAGTATFKTATFGKYEDSGVLYSDSLVTITNDSVTFHHYSFPFFTRGRTVLFTDIEYIDVKKPSVLTGKWRIAGSGNISTWFPMDSQRPSRDRIFHATIKTRGMNVGFTVEHPSEVTAILKKKGLIRSDELLMW
jgi:hypothetical protein